MVKALKKLSNSVKGAMDVSGIVIDVVLVTALIPVLATFVSDANLSGTEATLLGLTTLFIVLGLVFMIGRQTGLIKK
jgi:hypothetical protein